MQGVGLSMGSIATTPGSHLVESCLAMYEDTETEDGWQAYYMAMSNHLRINNATSFLHAQAASLSLRVEDALEGIVM